MRVLAVGLWLPALLLLMGLIWLPIVAQVWQRSYDTRGRVLASTIWGITAFLCVFSVTARTHPSSDATNRLAGVALAAFMGVAALATLVARFSRANTVRQRGGGHLVAAVLAYSAIQVVSGFVNRQIGGGGLLSASVALIYLPATFLVVWAWSGDRDQLLTLARRVTFTIVGASLVISVLEPAWSQITDIPRRLHLGPIVWRVAGVTPHPNLLSMVAGLGAILAFTAPSRRGRVCGLVACTTALLLGESRSAAIALCVSLLVYLIFSSRSPAARAIMLSPVLAAGVLYASQQQALTQLEGSQLGADASTLNSRAPLWELVRFYQGQHPLLGWGPFAFDDTTFTPFSHIWANNAHDQLLQSLVEGGILGVIAFASIVVCMLLIAWRARRVAVIPACVTFVLVMMTTEVPLTVHIYRANFVVVLGLIVALILIAGAREAPPDQKTEASEDARLMAAT